MPAAIHRRARGSGAPPRSASAVFAIALLAAGCAAYRPANARLAHWNPDYGYRPRRTYAERPMGDVLLVLAFSGGGTRAAALSYGVLEELRDTRFAVDASERRLLDEVALELLRPRNRVRLAGSFFDLSELAVQLYDQDVFDHTTFA